MSALQSIFKRREERVIAVDEISFEVHKGEVVGLIGPNGAGKTTTLKVLSGILHPTSGTVSVLGCEPSQRKTKYLQRIALIRGSRPIPVPSELTVLDALIFQKLVYEVEDRIFNRSLNRLKDILELGPILNRQVRALSLGERMRAGLAWALIYEPKILFLDEPTIGLDTVATHSIRSYIKDYCSASGATAILTSHYMADVEYLCERVILIDEGIIAFDGKLMQLAKHLAPYKLLKLILSDDNYNELKQIGDVIEMGERTITLRIPRYNITNVISKVLEGPNILDFSLSEPPLESVLDKFYQKSDKTL